MSYSKPIFDTSMAYAVYKSNVLSLAAINTNYILFTLPKDDTKKFYPELAYIYYNSKINSSDSITISCGWISTEYKDWVTSTNTVGGSLYSTGYHQNLTMVGDTYSTPPYRRYAAVGGTPIYLRTGASKTGSTIQITVSISGYWTGETINGLP
jgi:hypothetical protein